MYLKVVACDMKKFIIPKIIRYIKNNTNYNNTKLKEIEYGIISIYLTISKIFIILVLSLVFNIFREVIIFMLIFNILRTTGFGLHATKSWICLISSILMFIGLPLICMYISIPIYIKLIMGIIGIFLMYKNAPADTKKRPIVSKKKRLILKLISTILAVIFSVSSIVIKSEFLSNCLIFGLMLENILISPFTYKLFKLPYNNYITFLKNHPEYLK